MTTTDTEPKRGRPPKPAQARFADALESLLEDYATLPDQDRYQVDKALTQHLDLMPKDWLIATRALIEALNR